MRLLLFSMYIFFILFMCALIVETHSDEYQSHSRDTLNRTKRKNSDEEKDNKKSKNKGSKTMPKPSKSKTKTDLYPKQPSSNTVWDNMVERTYPEHSYNLPPEQINSGNIALFYPIEGKNYDPTQTHHKPSQPGNEQKNKHENKIKIKSKSKLKVKVKGDLDSDADMKNIDNGLADDIMEFSMDELAEGVGGYGSDELGRLVADNSTFGVFGYYDTDLWFKRCKCPSQVVTDPITGLTHIPWNSTYDPRCRYFDYQPPNRHPVSNWMVTDGGDTTMAAFSSVVVLVLNCLAQSLAIGWNFKPSCDKLFLPGE